MKKISSLKSMHSLRTRTPSSAHSPIHTPLHRSQSTTSAVSLGKTKTKTFMLDEGLKITEKTTETMTEVETMPHHDDAHAGPYGVEAPLDWSFVVTVTDVTVSVKTDGVGEVASERCDGVQERLGAVQQDADATKKG